MMDVVPVPPFETLYETHRDGVYRYLRRQSRAGEADDAFQDTFLRALRAYPRLRSGEHLRAWLYTIATRVAIDGKRRPAPRPVAQPPELAVLTGRPPHAELEHLTDGLPPTERAAVVLRYGYDLSYADIASALGSTEAAARQAASSGVRRLRERSVQP